MKRNTFGQALEDVTDEVSALDDQRVVFRLKNPFPMLAFALANPGQPAFIMPERVAQTDPFKHIQDTTGSGPFRFKADEFNSGSFVAYERNLTYRPIESGQPSLTAGPKIAHFDRVEWRSIPDSATTAAALLRGGSTGTRVRLRSRSRGLEKIPRSLSCPEICPLWRYTAT
jgi:peptide/nickel transport system substrate-binding protein